MKTQIEIIKEKLLREGKVSNEWCMKNYIWRLSHIIWILRGDGMMIHGEFIKKGNRKTRTFQYYI